MRSMDLEDQQEASDKPRGRGRPSKLTAALIVRATRELLAIRQPGDVSFALLARRLGVPASSIYNYFPNRDVLFATVAADVFSDFRFDDPGDGAPWRTRLRAWLDEVDRFFDHHPVAFRVMATSGQASPSWVHVRAPLLRVLRQLGFVERNLALVHSWFEGQVIGLLLIESHASRNRAAFADTVKITEDEDSDVTQHDAERRRHLSSIRRDEVLSIGFDALLAALEQQARNVTVRTGP